MNRILRLGIAASTVIVAGFQPSHAQTVTFETSPYWCDRLGGSHDGASCSAEYVRDQQPCEKFEELQPDDESMRGTIEEMRNTDLCLADVVDAAKANTLRLRADLMGYVTAGSNEYVNDPVSPDASDIVERAKNGGAPFWPLASYYLYQCVVDICESK